MTHLTLLTRIIQIHQKSLCSLISHGKDICVNFGSSWLVIYVTLPSSIFAKMVKLIRMKILVKWIFMATLIMSLNISLVTLFLPAQDRDINSVNPLVLTCMDTVLNNMTGPIEPTFESPDFAEIYRRFPWIRSGGLYSPIDCKASHRVAILVAFRQRTPHLKTLLVNLHPFLLRQQLEYGIYVIEQAMPGTFNKGMLLNIGYLEVMKRHNYQCVIFHDVDLLPEDDRNIYSCPDQPRHHAAAVDKFNYTGNFGTTFGGVTALTRHHMVAINGFSNIYFGWGSEDDEIENRFLYAGFNRTQYGMDVSRYKMIQHGSDKSNPWVKRKNGLTKSYKVRMKIDGLNSLKNYEVQMVEELPTHTRMLVYIDEFAVKHSFVYTYYAFGFYTKLQRKYKKTQTVLYPDQS